MRKKIRWRAPYPLKVATHQFHRVVDMVKTVTRNGGGRVKKTLAKASSSLSSSSSSASPSISRSALDSLQQRLQQAQGVITKKIALIKRLKRNSEVRACKRTLAKACRALSQPTGAPSLTSEDVQPDVVAINAAINIIMTTPVPVPRG